MCGYRFREETLTFVALSGGNQLLKERICSQKSKFFHLKADPTLKGHFAREANWVDGWMDG